MAHTDTYSGQPPPFAMIVTFLTDRINYLQHLVCRVTHEEWKWTVPDVIHEIRQQVDYNMPNLNYSNTTKHSMQNRYLIRQIEDVLPSEMSIDMYILDGVLKFTPYFK